MLKTVLAAAFAIGIAAAISPDSLAAPELRIAQATTPQTTPTPAPPQQKATTKKPLTAQQQKMKTCAGQWAEEKTKTGAKGRAAYRKFMSDCLKKPAA
ncbi:MAG TPA: PsiF family protein [Xanthobacteraceae bacterium]|jgi:hypothetical protein